MFNIKKKISAEDFVILQFNLVVNHTQDFANSLETDKIDFNKGLFIMVYFYIYTYMLMFSLKKDYPIDYINYLREEIIEGYLKTINSTETKQEVRNYYKELETLFNDIFKENSLNPEIFADYIINELFDKNTNIYNTTKLLIMAHISADFKFILDTTNKFKILL